jgi:hypothetical protein
MTRPQPVAGLPARKNETLALVEQLRSDSATGKGSAIGPSLAKLVPFGQALGLQGNRTAFEAKVNTLKANLTLDNLKLLKGAMSDKDLLFLNSIGSSLDTNMTEKAFNDELDRIKGKLQGATPSASSPAQSGSGSLAEQVSAKGYDYAQMKADGHSDAEIKASLGL